MKKTLFICTTIFCLFLSLQAADPREEIRPILIAKFVVDQLYSVGFTSGYGEPTNMVLSYERDDRSIVATYTFSSRGLKKTWASEYLLYNLCARFHSFADNPTIIIAGTSEQKPRHLAIVQNIVKGDEIYTSVEFEHPIRSFCLSKDGSFLYVTLENLATYLVSCRQPNLVPQQVKLPEHGGIQQVEGIFNPYQENCIVSSPTHPCCASYFYAPGAGGIFYKDDCQDENYSHDLPPLPHCLCDVSHNTWALVRCVQPDTLCVYTPNEKKVGIFLDDLTSRPSCLAFNTFGDALIIGYTNGVVEIRDVQDHAWKASMYLEMPDEETNHHYEISTQALSPLRRLWKSEIMIHGPKDIYLLVAYKKDGEERLTVSIYNIGPMVCDVVKKARSKKAQDQTEPENL